MDLNGLFTLDDDVKKPNRDEEKKVNNSLTFPYHKLRLTLSVL